jgi:two-component system response regulator AtoC
MSRILLVDDEADVRRALATFLRGMGHDVRLAANGVEAIAALRDSADLLITDINMPDMDGIEMVTTLREAASTMPIIAMSGGGLFDKGMLLDAAEALGADLALEKPFDLEVLRAAVEKLIGTAS